MGYASPIIHRVEQYLLNLENNLKSKCETSATQHALSAAKELGYGEPFDQEQAQMNALIRENLAGETAARAIWSFYHDFKMARAANSDAA